MTVAGRSRPGEATERKSQRQGPGCIKPCFEIIVTSSLNLKLFFCNPTKVPSQVGGEGGRDEVWDLETMFSQFSERSPCVLVSG